MVKHAANTHRNLEDFAAIASDWFWETDADHRFVFLSGRVESVLRVSQEEVLGRSRTALADTNLQEPKWQAHLADLEAHRVFKNFEYSYVRPTDGKVLWLRVSGQPRFDSSGAFIGYRGIGNDITAEIEALERLKKSNATLAERNKELNETRRALERSANQDSLTGLLNRNAFEHDLAEALNVEGMDVILLYVDLDRFKWINDTFGHTVGDQVLIVVADRIKRFASGIGPVYRLGGDEFLIVLADNAEIENARWISDSILDVMGETVQTPDHNIAITASVGLAHGKGGQVTPRQLVANADIALFEAKNGGRACARELTPGMLQEMADRRQLASELPNAIQNRQIIAYYQPQIDARTGRVIGAEALARWDHPRLGVMAPAAFLDIATELGLVASVDRCVMRQAMLFAVSAAETGTPLQSISVNLSADRLMDPNLTDDIQVLWAGQGSRLAIELLETIDLDDVADGSLVSDNLRRLRDMGVQIEMDDFGSGRASITSLLSVQPDRVKIDRHLIQAATRDPIKRQVVSAILDMAQALGIESLAEGAETTEDVAIIQGLGCQLFQGYAFSRPLPETEFAAYLREQNGYAFGDQADARAAI